MGDNLGYATDACCDRRLCCLARLEEDVGECLGDRGEEEDVEGGEELCRVVVVPCKVDGVLEVVLFDEVLEVWAVLPFTNDDVGEGGVATLEACHRLYGVAVALISMKFADRPDPDAVIAGRKCKVTAQRLAGQSGGECRLLANTIVDRRHLWERELSRKAVGDDDRLVAEQNGESVDKANDEL